MLVIAQLTEKLKKLVGKDKLISVAAILGIAAMVLLMFSECGSSEPKTEKISDNDAQQYRQELESELGSILSSIDGAGQVRVMITLQGSYEYIYAQENKNSSDSSQKADSSDLREETENSYIIIDTDEGEKALIRTELSPSIAGVVVVCEGADDELVCQRIMLAVTTALDISSKRVCVIKLSK